MLERICHCGTCQDAWNASLADNVKSIENGECLLWRIQIAVCQSVICVGLVQEFFRREGVEMSEMDARVYVADVIMRATPFANDQLEGAMKSIADAYQVHEDRRKWPQ